MTFLQGRILTGPIQTAPYFHFLILSVIWASAVVWFQVRPIMVAAGYDYLIYLIVVLTLFFSYTFFKTALTDPGVILRNEDIDELKITTSEEEIEKRRAVKDNTKPSIY